MNKPLNEIATAEALIAPLRELYRNGATKPSAINIPGGRVFDALCDAVEWAAAEPQQSEMFVVVTLGYWGKGVTLQQAAQHCLEAGGERSQPVVAYAYVGEAAELDKITVDGGGSINYPMTCQSVKLFGPREGQKIKLGYLL